MDGTLSEEEQAINVPNVWKVYFVLGSILGLRLLRCIGEAVQACD